MSSRTMVRAVWLALACHLLLGGPANGQQMDMAGPLGVPVDRMGSGTTWIPDAVSLPSLRTMIGRWDLMMHGFAFLQYDYQGGPRGGDQFGSLNWGMLMASHELGGGRAQFRTMLSLDPATVTPRGYPLLLQTGETYGGAPLRDRQHPHDFWMELGALYERALTPGVGASFYAAASGEPALGPVAFMHRPSAMDNPLAPLSHHWADATHISFGVLTAGVFGRRWKLEGSLFNGREPDEARWGFDRVRLDSYSGRVTVNPGSQWSVTAGYGFLKSPEGLDPNEPLRRFTASVLYGRRVGPSGQWSAAIIWGANEHSGSGSVTQSLLLETDAILDRNNTVLMRAELVQKSGEDLVLPVGAGVSPERIFNIGTFSAGYVREFGRVLGLTVGVGGMATLNLLPADVGPFYGGRWPLGGVVFLRVRPFHQPMSGMSGM